MRKYKSKDLSCPVPEWGRHGSSWAHTSGKRSRGLQEGFEISPGCNLNTNEFPQCRTIKIQQLPLYLGEFVRTHVILAPGACGSVAPSCGAWLISASCPELLLANRGTSIIDNPSIKKSKNGGHKIRKTLPKLKKSLPVYTKRLLAPREVFQESDQNYLIFHKSLPVYTKPLLWDLSLIHI